MGRISICVFSVFSNGLSGHSGFPRPANFTSACRVGTLNNHRQIYKGTKCIEFAVMLNLMLVLLTSTHRHSAKEHPETINHVLKLVCGFHYFLVQDNKIPNEKFLWVFTNMTHHFKWCC